MATHDYTLTVEWTGNRGDGTASYRSYDRDLIVSAAGPAPIDGSSDPSFRGDRTRWNPEQLLLASVAQCHLLWYLHLAAVNGVVVTSYVDRPTAVLAEHADGSGEFTEITLHPLVAITAESDAGTAESLHAQANAKCFIARSLNLPVGHDATTVVATAG
jgi:organic hydroperoxide reductase OsmC/OhrA